MISGKTRLITAAGLFVFGLRLPVDLLATAAHYPHFPLCPLSPEFATACSQCHDLFLDMRVPCSNLPERHVKLHHYSEQIEGSLRDFN